MGRNTFLVCILGAALLSASRPVAAGDRPGLGDTLDAIELHYNRLATLQVDFEQKLSYQGRTRRKESGTLYLRRPSQMRWEYDNPEGKLLVGDGEILHMYTPYSNQVRQVKLEEAGDLRAPLAFLLGRLKFRKAFKNLRFEEIDGKRVIVGEGRTGEESYRTVEFHYEPGEYRLTKLRIERRDGAVTAFRFSNEIVNPRLEKEMFVFNPPPDADVFGPLAEEEAGGG